MITDMVLNGVFGGKVEVLRWHTGASYRMTIFNQAGNSVYFVLDSEEVDRFFKALRLGYGQMISGRAQVDISTLPSNTREVAAGDVFAPGDKTKVWLQPDQILNI